MGKAQETKDLWRAVDWEDAPQKTQRTQTLRQSNKTKQQKGWDLEDGSGAEIAPNGGITKEVNLCGV